MFPNKYVCSVQAVRIYIGFTLTGMLYDQNRCLKDYLADNSQFDTWKLQRVSSGPHVLSWSYSFMENFTGHFLGTTQILKQVLELRLDFTNTNLPETNVVSPCIIVEILTKLHYALQFQFNPHISKQEGELSKKEMFQNNHWKMQMRSESASEIKKRKKHLLEIDQLNSPQTLRHSPKPMWPGFSTMLIPHLGKIVNPLQQSLHCSQNPVFVTSGSVSFSQMDYPHCCNTQSVVSRLFLYLIVLILKTSNAQSFIFHICFQFVTVVLCVLFPLVLWTMLCLDAKALSVY